MQKVAATAPVTDVLDVAAGWAPLTAAARDDSGWRSRP